MRTLLAVALLVGLAPAAPVPKGLKKKVNDAEAIVGIWMHSSGTRDENFEFTPDGKMRAWMGNGGPGGTTFGYSWTLDPTATPKRMTWGGANDPKPQWECVYELDGDTLRICYIASGQPVPTAVAREMKGGFYCDLRRDTSPAK